MMTYLAMAVDQYNPTVAPAWQWPTEADAQWAACQDRSFLERLGQVEKSPAWKNLTEKVIIELVSHEVPLPSVVRNGLKEPDAATVARLDQELALRAQALTTLAEIVDWTTQPEPLGSLAYRALGFALESHTFDMAFPILSPYMAPTDQSPGRSLLRSWMYWTEDGNVSARRTRTPLIEHTPPEVVGALLVEHIVDQEFGHLANLRPEHPWPLPVLAIRDQRAAYVARQGRDPLREFYQNLEAALFDPIYPAALRERLYEACRALRPHVAEDRYRAEDRQRELTGRPALAGKRIRSRS